MFPKYFSRSIATAVMALIGTWALEAHGQLETGWKIHDRSRPAPKVVDPGEEQPSVKPPGDAVVLFDGTNFDSWTGGVDKWKIVDGVMESVAKAGPVMTKEEFGDCQLHIEWSSPSVIKGDGQQRGNSGVFLMNSFELQVLDSFQNETYADGSAASVYGQFPPLVNASRGPGKWQSYDIIFRAPRFDGDGRLQQRASMTVLHNGVLVQDNTEVLGPTNWIKHRHYVRGKTTGKIRLQDHGNPMRYRNIWVRRLATERAAPKSPYPAAAVSLPAEKLDSLTGTYQSANQQDFHVMRDGGNIYCKFYGVKMKMVALSESEFLFEQCAGKISFQRNSSGQVQSAQLYLDAAGERTGKRKTGKTDKARTGSKGTGSKGTGSKGSGRKGTGKQKAGSPGRVSKDAAK